MSLTEEEIKAIDREALEKFPVEMDGVHLNGGWLRYDYNEPMRNAYGQAITQERIKAKALIDALGEIIKSWDERCNEREEHKTNTEYGFDYWTPVASLVEAQYIAKARIVVNQYNNKTV